MLVCLFMIIGHVTCDQLTIGPHKEEMVVPEYIDGKDADTLFQEAEALALKLREVGKEERKADMLQLYKRAALQGHTEAKAKMAMQYLLGDYSKDEKEIGRSALFNLYEDGHVIGKLGVAFMKYIGYGATQNVSQALQILQSAADGQNAHAAMAIGNYLYLGNNGSMDSPAHCEDALKYYITATKQVIRDTATTGGIQLSKVRIVEEEAYPDFVSELVDEKTMDYWKLLAANGDHNVALTLGHLFLSGSRGVVQDFTQARTYLQQAAAAGNSYANANLGKMYMDGSEETPKNDTMAVHYYTKAAEMGNPIGHSGLAIAYSNGKGVPKNDTMAFHHFEKAAQQGWVDGLLNLGHYYFNGIGTERNHTKAFELFKQASAHGHTLALSNLALLYAHGYGTERNCHQALNLYKQVAEKSRDMQIIMDAHEEFRDGKVKSSLLKYLYLSMLGVEQAQTNAAYMLEEYGPEIDDLVPDKDWKLQAFRLWKSAAKQNYGLAKLTVADYYYFGSAGPVDYVSAAEWYQNAGVNHSNGQALFNFAYLLQHGLGVPKVSLASRVHSDVPLIDESTSLFYYDAAVKVSPDAYFPVLLATSKMRFIIALHEFSTVLVDQFDNLDSFYPGWDFVIIGLLLIALGIVIRLRNS